MAYGYGNRTFAPTVKQNWICIGDGEESAFFLNQFGENSEAIPAGAVRASDNYIEAENQNIAMNAEAGFLYNSETRRFVAAPTASEAFLEFPAEFTTTQQAMATSKGRRVMAGKISREKLESDLAQAASNGNTIDPPILNYLLTLSCN